MWNCVSPSSLGVNEQVEGAMDKTLVVYGKKIKVAKPTRTHVLSLVCHRIEPSGLLIGSELIGDMEPLINVLTKLTHRKRYKLELICLDPQIFGSSVLFDSCRYYPDMNTGKLTRTTMTKGQLGEMTPERLPSLIALTVADGFLPPLRPLYIKRLCVMGNFVGDLTFFPYLEYLSVEGRFEVEEGFQLPHTLEEFYVDGTVTNMETVRLAVISSNLRKFHVEGMEEIKPEESTTLRCGYNGQWKMNKKRNLSLVEIIDYSCRFTKKRLTMKKNEKLNQNFEGNNYLHVELSHHPYCQEPRK